MTEKSPINQTELSELKIKLEQKLNVLTDNCEKHNKSIAQEIPIDNEEASSLIEEIELSQTENLMDSKEAEQIVNALKRIQDGSYGICSSCSSFIGKERLFAVPSAQLCIQCQSEKENKS